MWFGKENPRADRQLTPANTTTQTNNQQPKTSLNVSITRARRHLLLVGHAQALAMAAAASAASKQQSGGGVDMWGRILQRARVCQHWNDLVGMVLGQH